MSSRRGLKTVACQASVNAVFLESHLNFAPHPYPQFPEFLIHYAWGAVRESGVGCEMSFISTRLLVTMAMLVQGPPHFEDRWALLMAAVL